jgi:hypothetical protein
VRQLWIDRKAAEESQLVPTSVQVEGLVSPPPVEVYVSPKVASYFQYGDPMRLVARRFWRFRWLEPDSRDSRWRELWWGGPPALASRTAT